MNFSSSSAEGEQRPRRRGLPRRRMFTVASPQLIHFSLLCIFSITSPTIRAEQRIVEHPQNTTSHLNETVVLKCRVEDQKGTLQWVKNGFGLGTVRELPLLERYTMIGKMSLGEYHLQIRNVTVDDDDLYECQLSPTDTEPIVVSQLARLTVLAEPDPPRLLGPNTNQQLHSPLVVSEGIAVNLNCQSVGGRPPPRLKWLLSTDPAAERIVHHLVNDSKAQPYQHPIRGRERMPTPYPASIHSSIEWDTHGFSTVTSNLTFSPTKAEHGKFIFCVVEHETNGGEGAPKQVGVALDVLYRPKVRVTVEEGDSSLIEGGRAVLRCNVDARPLEDLKLQWGWGGEERRLAVVDAQTAVLTDLRLKDNGAKVGCTATNSLGSETSSLKLNIPYGPRWMSTNQTRLVQRGDAVSLQCEVVSNPPAEVKWFHADKPDFIAVGPNYTIANIQEWEAGRYKCVAEVQGFPPKTLTHFIHMKGPPVVHLSQKMNDEGNGAVTLTCEIQSRTFPLRVLWLHRGVVVDYNRAQSRYHTRELKRDDGMDSYLTIQQFTPEHDYGLYNCSAQNDFGISSDQQDIFERSVWETVRESVVTLPKHIVVALLIGAICLLLCALLLCCMCCHCCSSRSKSSNYSHDHCDVSVKCEALDGAQFYPELYGPSQMEDYAPISQNDPDLDYLPRGNGVVAYGPAATTIDGHDLYHHHPSTTYAPPPPLPLNQHQQQQYDMMPYGTFISSGPDMYGGGGEYIMNRPNTLNGAGLQHPQQLETLTEVATPDSAEGCGHMLQAPVGLHDRPVSRVSTHV